MFRSVYFHCVFCTESVVVLFYVISSLHSLICASSPRSCLGSPRHQFDFLLSSLSFLSLRDRLNWMAMPIDFIYYIYTFFFWLFAPIKWRCCLYLRIMSRVCLDRFEELNMFLTPMELKKTYNRWMLHRLLVSPWKTVQFAPRVSWVCWRLMLSLHI